MIGQILRDRRGPSLAPNQGELPHDSYQWGGGSKETVRIPPSRFTAIHKSPFWREGPRQPSRQVGRVFGEMLLAEAVAIGMLFQVHDDSLDRTERQVIADQDVEKGLEFHDLRTFP